MAKNVSVTDNDHKDFKMVAVEMGISGMTLFSEMLAYWKINHPLKWDEPKKESA